MLKIFFKDSPSLRQREVQFRLSVCKSYELTHQSPMFPFKSKPSCWLLLHCFCGKKEHL